ncbi:MAG: transcriptional repressor [Sphingomonadaceae bacterium]
MAAMHTHIPAGSPALVRAAEAALTAQGVQWTTLRRQVFETLSEAAEPVSAYDVADHLSEHLGRRIAPNSIYRILDLFVENNLAKRVESRNAFIANTHPACAHDCIFFICEVCGRIDHLDDDSFMIALRLRAQGKGFLPRRPIVELIGQCNACQNKA